MKGEKDVFKQHKSGQSYTLPETNIAPENRPLEKEIPIGNHQTVSFREGIYGPGKAVSKDSISLLHPK